MEPKSEGVVRRNPLGGKQKLRLEGLESRALVQHEVCNALGGNFRHKVDAVELAASRRPQIEGEGAERLDVPYVELQFLAQFAAQRVERRLAGLDRPAETGPMTGIDEVRPIVPELHQIAPVGKHEQRGDRVHGVDGRPGPDRKVPRSRPHYVTRSALSFLTLK